MSRLRVLVVRVGAMGDVLHALPAVAALREQWPEAEITWVVDPRWAPLLVGPDGKAPVVSTVLLAETRLWSRAPLSKATLRSVRKLRRDLREQPFDVAVDMQGTLRSAVIGRFARGAPLVGFTDPRERAAGWLYGRRILRRGAHVVEQGAHLLGEAVGASLTPAVPALPRDQTAERWAEDLLRTLPPGQPVALLAPTAGWGAKQWPAAHFGELGRRLTSRGWTVLLNAAGAEEPTCRAVAEASGGTASVVACSVPQLGALLGRTQLMVGGDSGPVHLAAALGTPLVALFGPTDPARNGPWGPGPKTVLRHRSSVTSHQRVPATEAGLARLTVEEVLLASEEVLRAPRPLPLP